MRKQTEFIVRIVKVSPNPSAVNDSMTTTDFSLWLKANYLDQGWEVMSSQHIGIEPNAHNIAVFLAKYEEVGELLAPVARRGRPRKVEEEVVAPS